MVAAVLLGAALLSGATVWLVLGGAVTLLALVLAWHGAGVPGTLGAAGLATGLLAVQVLVPPAWGWGTGLVLIGVLLVTALTAWLGGAVQGGNRAFRTLALGAAGAAYLHTQALWFAGGASSLAWATAAVLGGVVFALFRRALLRQHQPLVRRLSLLVTLVYTLDLALVLAPLWAAQSPSTTALLAASGVTWALAVALVVAVVCLPNKAPVGKVERVKKELPAWRVRLDDYLTLMKVRVSSLLLLTTLGGMVVAAGGWPGWSLVGWVLLGGLLSVGGAGALNHFLDRDLDINMGRTSLRPLPAGRMSPRHVLVFGLVLSVLQFALFWWKVNPFAAWLSTGGLLYYVVIYTMWLKRTSTQNIVIGGAAGAFPPLVGWAAVTGDLSLGAWLLFAIIFVWTPPHFWALALMRKADYARAGVPMLPVVHGEAATRVQILLYTLGMIAVTLALVPLHLMGWLYLAAALLLNAKFLWDALRLLRQPSNAAALTLYKYSLLYLALLFVAMALDRSLV